jgi:hypothetical protein
VEAFYARMDTLPEARHGFLAADAREVRVH